MNDVNPPKVLGTERKVAVAVVIALLLGCMAVLWPFASAMLWAVVLCVASWPTYLRLLGWCRQRRTLAAGIISLTMIGTVLLPLVIVGFSIGDNITNFISAVQHWSASGPPHPPEWLAKIPFVGEQAVQYWRELMGDSARLRIEAGKIAEWVSPYLLQGGVVVGGGVIQLAMSIMVAFLIFRDGGTLGERVTVAAKRIGGDRGQQLLEMAAGTIRGVVYGVLGTALAQGAATGIGLLVAGVPNAALLALIACFSSVIPMVGTALVWLPAALWLFSKGSVSWGVFMLVWGFIVSNIDNILKPYLISRGSEMPFILIFFGVLGGAMTFGFIGVFLGPTLLAVGYRLAREWMAERTS